MVTETNDPLWAAIDYTLLSGVPRTRGLHKPSNVQPKTTFQDRMIAKIEKLKQQQVA
jgi:hypothetical protein